MPDLDDVECSAKDAASEITHFASILLTNLPQLPTNTHIHSRYPCYSSNTINFSSSLVGTFIREPSRRQSPRSKSTGEAEHCRGPSPPFFRPTLLPRACRALLSRPQIFNRVSMFLLRVGGGHSVSSSHFDWVASFRYRPANTNNREGTNGVYLERKCLNFSPSRSSLRNTLPAPGQLATILP